MKKAVLESNGFSRIIQPYQNEQTSHRRSRDVVLDDVVITIVIIVIIAHVFNAALFEEPREYRCQWAWVREKTNLDAMQWWRPPCSNVSQGFPVQSRYRLSLPVSSTSLSPSLTVPSPLSPEMTSSTTEEPPTDDDRVLDDFEEKAFFILSKTTRPRNWCITAVMWPYPFVYTTSTLCNWIMHDVMPVFMLLPFWRFARVLVMPLDVLFLREVVFGDKLRAHARIQ